MADWRPAVSAPAAVLAWVFPQHLARASHRSAAAAVQPAAGLQAAALARARLPPVAAPADAVVQPLSAAGAWRDADRGRAAAHWSAASPADRCPAQNMKAAESRSASAAEAAARRARSHRAFAFHGRSHAP